MKLVIAVVQAQDAQILVDALSEAGYGITRVSSEGGFLHEGNVTLLLGVHTHEVEEVLRLIRLHCHTRTRYISPLSSTTGVGEVYPTAPIEVQVGGATVFVVAIEQYQRV